jgi:hypothetical protein
MLGKFKSALQILIVIALAVQLAGCFYDRRDDRRRHDEPQQNYDYNRGSSVDIHLQGQ